MLERLYPQKFLILHEPTEKSVLVVMAELQETAQTSKLS